jgi:cation transport regulator
MFINLPHIKISMKINMPFKKKSELPKQIKDNLPSHAQEIFKEAFNSAYKQYKDEETAIKVAWSAVKNKYKKENNTWVEK